MHVFFTKMILFKKIVLHVPTEFPMVDDSGFVVSPGFETFVSVTTYKVRGSVTQFNLNYKLNFNKIIQGHSKTYSQSQ